MAEVKFAFPRKATGLVRELGWWSAFSISLSYTIGSGINYWVVQASYWHPGSLIPVAYIIGALPAIFVAYVITEMGIMMPRSGGSYIYVSRVLDPHIGFLGDWLYFVANNFATGLLAVIGAGFWEKVINLLGVATGNAAWAAFALDNMGLALIACVIITLYTLLSLLGIRVFRWYVAGLVAIGIVGSFLGIFATFYGVANPSYVKEAWNLTYGEGSWEQVQQVATTNGWATFVEEHTASAGGVGGATIGNFADTFWAYWGSTAACYFGGEMKSPKRGFILGVFIATLFIMIWYVLTAIGLYTAYGDFVSQYCYVYGEGYGDQVTAMRVMDPSLPLFTVPLAHGMVWLQAIFAFIPALWISNCAGATLLVGPRQPFAWSFDKFFPDAFNRVNERFHSPHWSVILTALIAYTFVPLSLPPRTFVATVDATFIFIISQLFIALAGVAVPYKRPDIWERGFKATLAGIPLISIVGACAVLFWVWGMAISASWLEFWGMLYLAFWVFVGSLIWFAYAERNRRMGIALQDIYGEIPPA
ncbi:MAG: APC family permease [Candidatus Bathyarchaeia archaeon]